MVVLFSMISQNSLLPFQLPKYSAMFINCFKLNQSCNSIDLFSMASVSDDGTDLALLSAGNTWAICSAVQFSMFFYRRSTNFRSNGGSPFLAWKKDRHILTTWSAVKSSLLLAIYCPKLNIPTVLHVPLTKNSIQISVFYSYTVLMPILAIFSSIFCQYSSSSMPALNPKSANSWSICTFDARYTISLILEMNALQVRVSEGVDAPDGNLLQMETNSIMASGVCADCDQQTSSSSPPFPIPYGSVSPLCFSLSLMQSLLLQISSFLPIMSQEVSSSSISFSSSFFSFFSYFYGPLLSLLKLSSLNALDWYCQ